MAPIETLQVDKPNIIIVASPRARRGTASSLLRLVRDHCEVLRRFIVNTTEGTGRQILATGLYSEGEVRLHRGGRDGGLAQLAARVARGDIAAVVLLLDPSDPWTDAVENRALKRVCIQLRIRLMTTFAAANRWLTFEADKVPGVPPATEPSRDKFPQGIANVSESGEFLDLPIEQRTMALISHDRMKLEMVEFANAHASLLANHHRILTTGTTGTLLKLLFYESAVEESLVVEIQNAAAERRFVDVLLEILETLEVKPRDRNLPSLLQRLRSRASLIRNSGFANKIFALPSGPLGGDVLVADEVLENKCHSIIFFHDPSTAHPHNDDIRLLEHSAQLPGVFAECVSDRKFAEEWIDGLRSEQTSERSLLTPAQIVGRVLRPFGVNEVVLVAHNNDEDGKELGLKLARACAGFFHQRLLEVLEHKRFLRVGIAWGWGSSAVLAAIEEMETHGIIERPQDGTSITWTPLIGSISSELTDREATIIAEGFRRFYGGNVEGYPCGGFALKEQALPETVRDLSNKVELSDLIVTAAAPWEPDTALIRETGLSDKYFPPFDAADGLLAGVFLKKSGEEVVYSYTIVGLGYEGFQKAARNNAVILFCGGQKRRNVLLGAIRAKMVSTLITTIETGRWLSAVIAKSADDEACAE